MLFVAVQIRGRQRCDTPLLFEAILQQLTMSSLTLVFVLPLVFPVTCSCADSLSLQPNPACIVDGGTGEGYLVRFLAAVGLDVPFF